jgi:hypothetical protein
MISISLVGRWFRRRQSETNSQVFLILHASSLEDVQQFAHLGQVARLAIVPERQRNIPRDEARHAYATTLSPLGMEPGFWIDVHATQTDFVEHRQHRAH